MRIEKTMNAIAKLLVDTIRFICDLFKWFLMVLIIVGWTFCVFVIISTMRFLEKLPQKIERHKFIIKVKILKILEKVLTFFKK